MVFIPGKILVHGKSHEILVYLFVDHKTYVPNWFQLAIIWFSGDYQEYFGPHIDEDSIVYLQTANEFLHKEYPGIVTIAEEVSGMPGTCKTVEEDGLGFDYRLQN